MRPAYTCVLVVLSSLLFAQKPELMLPTGHTDKVSSAVYSPDGKYVLTASDDKTARIWDAVTGKMLQTLEGHTDKVSSAVYSPDVKYVLTASYDKTARIWDAVTGKMLQTLEGHTDEINSALFSPDGKRVLTASKDGTAKIWDGTTGKMLLTLEDPTGYPGWISSAVFSPDGKTCITVPYYETAKLWDAATGKMLQALEGHVGDTKTAIFSPDGKTVLTALGDKTAKLWDPNTGKVLRTLEGHLGRINSAIFSPDGKTVLTASRDKTAKIWDPNTGKVLRTLEGHLDDIRSAIFSPDGKVVLTASFDTVKLWDASTGQMLRSFEAHTDQINTAVFGPDGKTFLTASYDKTAKLWDAFTGQILRSFEGHTAEVRRVWFSRDGKTILTDFVDRKPTLWDVSGAKILHPFEDRYHIYDAEFSPDNKKVLTYGNYTPRLWDASTGKLLRSFEGHAGLVVTAVFSADGKTILTTSLDRTSKLWDVSTGQLLLSIEGYTSGVFNPDGKAVLTAYFDTPKLWDASTGQMLSSFVGHTDGVYTAVFSPDGKTVLTASGDKTAKLWDASTGQILRSFVGHTGQVYTAVFSPDGKTVLTASGDHTAKLWDASNGKILHSFATRETFFSPSARFSPDGKTILAYKTAELWDASSGKMLHSFDDNFITMFGPVFGPDGTSILTTDAVSYKVWDSRTYQIKYSLYSIDSTDWIATNDKGQFDCSKGAEKYLYFVVNDSTDKEEPWKVVDFDNLKERYYQPHLVPIMMGASDEPLRQVPSFEKAELPPACRTALRGDNLEIRLSNRGFGIGKVALSIDGIEVATDTRPHGKADRDKDSITYTVNLTDYAAMLHRDTVNVVKIVCWNGDNWMSSRPDTMHYTPRSKNGKGFVNIETTSLNEKPAFHGVFIGTSVYADPSLKLQYPSKDARSMVSALHMGASNFFASDSTHVQLLVSDSSAIMQPTKEHIVQALVALQKSKPDDVVFIYLSGHGISGGGNDGDFYYLTAQTSRGDIDALKDTFVTNHYLLSSMELTALLNKIPARKKVLVLDACASGKAAQVIMTAMKDVSASQIRALDRMKDRSGLYVLAGSAANAVSYETSVYGQGLLTYALLKGMRGDKLRKDGADEFIDIQPLLQYAVDEVPKLAQGIGGIQQPFFRSPDEMKSFDVGRITASDKKNIKIAEPKPVFMKTSLSNPTEHFDDLELSAKLDAALMEATAKGIDAPMIFTEAKDYPEAYRISGEYSHANGKLQLDYVVLKNKEKVFSKAVSINGDEQHLDDFITMLIADCKQRLK